MLGLLRNPAGQYTEHVALSGVSFSVSRGEKLAIIGRNGAGKSTLLKLVTRVIRPSSGEIVIRGETQALLQIGTGFHPEFTGRENARAYLAHLGITGAKADQAIVDVVEFAELEEYIDQPVKTYSTGMAMRLMFSAATVIKPELLILDEILGVGDAYFSKKSFERIRQMCAGNDTTLLLVSHDVYGASLLCDRMIWIDRGAIIADGPSVEVLKAYENSIRVQEEARLRKKLLDNLQPVTRKGGARSIIIELRARKNQPQQSPVYFSRLAVVRAGEEIASAATQGEANSSTSLAKLAMESSCWGEQLEWQGRLARPMLNYGSPFHKVGIVFVLPGADQAGTTPLELEIDYWSDELCTLDVVATDSDQREHALGELRSQSKVWSRFACIMPNSGAVGGGDDVRVEATDRHGTGRIEIVGFDAVDADGQPTLVVEHGKPLELVIQHRINDPTVAGPFTVVVAFHKNGVENSARVVSSDLLFDAKKQRQGVIKVSFPSMPLGAGTYAVSIMVAEDGYFRNQDGQFYTINNKVCSVRSKLAEITVMSNDMISRDTGVVLAGLWSLT